MVEMKVIPSPAKFKFLSYCGDRQGCGTIRVVYPSLLMNMYRYRGYIFEGDYLTSFINDASFYRGYTFVQFQRSVTEAHLNIFRHYVDKIRGNVRVPLIYEIDDLLEGIPDWNYASDYYNKNISRVYELMGLVDGMVVSTEGLKERYSKYCNNIVVIPNHLPKFVWGDITPRHLGKERVGKVRIGWAGSENHFCNIRSDAYKRGIRGGDFSDKILDYIRRTVNDYQWVISGACPIELDDLRDKIEIYPWVSIFNYPAHLRSLDLDIGLALLKDCEFNSCKSNIKVLEYSVVGVPGVYSKVGPYNNMTLASNNDLEVIDNIERLVNDRDFRRDVYNKDLGIIRDQIYWEDDDGLNLRRYINSYLGLFNKGLE